MSMERIKSRKYKPFADRLVKQDDPIERKIAIFARHIQEEMRYDNHSGTVGAFDAYSYWKAGDCRQQAEALSGLLQSHGISSVYREDKDTLHATVIIPHPAGNVFVDYYLSNEMGIRTPNHSWRIQRDGTFSVRKRKGATDKIHPLDKLLQEIYNESP